MELQLNCVCVCRRNLYVQCIALPYPEGRIFEIYALLLTPVTMAEAFFTVNLPHLDEEMDVGKDSPSPGPEENSGIKVEDEGESGSDIIIEDERFASRSSSPDIEVVKVLKSATRITVDLTGDDDDDTAVICDSLVQSEASAAPVVDLSNEENGYCEPSRMHQEREYLDNSSFTFLPPNTDNTGYTHSQFQHQSAADFGNTSKPNPLGASVKQEEDDTISLLRALESYASLPKAAWQSSSVEPSDLANMYDRQRMPYEKKPSGHSSAEMSTGSTTSVVMSAFDNRDTNSLLGGTAQVGTPFSDTPLDMSMSSGLSLHKGTTNNSYSGFPSGVPLHGSTNTSHTSSSSSLAYDGLNMNDLDSLLQKTEGFSTDFKSPVSTHPNSAFQAVTPSTSGNRIPDLVDFIATLQSTHTPSTSYNTGFNSNSCSQVDTTFENHSQSSWYTGSGGISSQSWESSLQSILTQLSGSYGSQSQGFPSSSTDTAHPSYVGNPSTSNGNYNQECKSEHMNKSSCGQQAECEFSNVLCPSTVLEHVSNVSNPGISGMLDLPSTSKSSTGVVPQATASSGMNTARPPSPEEHTFSCTICLDSVKTIQSSSRNLCSTVCGHVFCSDCLQEALKKKKECPMCRKRLGKKQYHPLFL